MLGEGKDLKIEAMLNALKNSNIRKFDDDDDDNDDNNACSGYDFGDRRRRDQRRPRSPPPLPPSLLPAVALGSFLNSVLQEKKTILMQQKIWTLIEMIKQTLVLPIQNQNLKLISTYQSENLTDKTNNVIE